MVVQPSAAFSPPALMRATASSLSMKNNDRAFVEKQLEDMMDNDWRLFRARLVAQERIEDQAAAEATAEGDAKLAKQGQLGDIFAGAISSIFSPKPPIAPTVTNKHLDTIFNGDSVGMPDDPFVSEAELPVFIQRKVMIDKHRWAHLIPHVEAGCVLVANEKLGGVFHQTVVLVIEHSESQGSTGIVINRPLNGDLMKIASESDSKLDLSLKLAMKSSPVTYGGPVNPEEYSILHGWAEVDGARKLAPGVFVGGSEELMNEVRINRFDPKNALFVKGHAAWVAGQLSREIAKNVWYPVAVSPDLMLRYAGAPTTEQDNASDLWSDILTCLGDEFANIAKLHASRGDKRMMP